MNYEPNSYWPALHEREPGRLSAVGYHALGEGFNVVAYWRRRRAVESILSRLGVRACRVLEGAVGVGAYAPLWKKIGVREWCGVDISARAVANLRERYPAHQFVEADLASTDPSIWKTVMERGPFDLVCGIDVLYHMTTDDSCSCALVNLARCVKPGGVLLLSDVFTEEPTTIAAHVRRRPLRYYESTLGPVGFTLVAREPVFSVLADPVPRARGPLTDRILYNTWRVAQKAVRLTHEPLRDPIGAAIAAALLPIDKILRVLGWARGVSLELAAFRRASTPRDPPVDLHASRRPGQRGAL